MKIIRNCGNCFHWINPTAAHPLGSFSLGVCGCPLPLSLSGFLIRQKPTSIDCSGCPAHRMKAVRKATPIPQTEQAA